MRLPRRVPWASISELDQICTWIYGNENDLESKRAAINRLSAWRFSTSLPHALETTLSLLTILVDDTLQSQNSTALRQSYALAIIRFVNGLVDPLQSGAYARSIASIASQIGLPLWLVELRHAATHEELPSLELLRDAASEAIKWLLHNYFLPTLSPQTDKQPVLINPLSPILKEYKRLLKESTRDGSLRKKLAPEISRLLREVERWIGEVKVSTWDSSMDMEDGGSKEKWAMERVCEALLEKGGLVPLSKAKRTSPRGPLVPPSPEYWVQLLNSIQSYHPTFASVLLATLISRVTSAGTEDPTFTASAAGWIVWIVDTWGEQADCSAEEAISQLIVAVGKENNQNYQLVRALIDSLAIENEMLLNRASKLLQALQNARVKAWDDDSIAVMEERLAEARERFKDSSDRPQVTLRTEKIDEATSFREGHPPRGWRLLDLDSGWKPAPIGMISTS